MRPVSVQNHWRDDRFGAVETGDPAGKSRPSAAARRVVELMWLSSAQQFEVRGAQPEGPRLVHLEVVQQDFEIRSDWLTP